MTYGRLLELIQAMSNEQRDMDVTISIEDDEFFAIDYLKFNKLHNILAENQPYLQVGGL